MPPTGTIATHGLRQENWEPTEFDFQVMEAKQPYDSRQMHRHSYYEIFYFAKGGGRHEIDLRQLPIESQSLHFLSPGQVHRVLRTPDSHGFVIQFSPEFFYSGLQAHDRLFDLPFFHHPLWLPVVQLKAESQATVYELVRQIGEENAHADRHSAAIIRRQIDLLLLYASRHHDQQPDPSIEPRNRELLRMFRKLLEEKFHQEHQCQFYAQALHVSADHLSQLTQKTWGKPASVLIHDRLMLEAVRLLVHSTEGIRQLAFALGFDDPSYFARTFKKYHGQSPSEFRDGFLSR